MFDSIRDTEAMDGVISQIPVKRLGLMDEVAELALFLALPRSSYMIGSDILIDGGISTIFSGK